MEGGTESHGELFLDLLFLGWHGFLPASLPSVQLIFHSVSGNVSRTSVFVPPLSGVVEDRQLVSCVMHALKSGEPHPGAICQRLDLN